MGWCVCGYRGVEHPPPDLTNHDHWRTSFCLFFSFAWDQVENLDKVFEMMDFNSDGKISKEELKDSFGVLCLQVTDAELDGLFYHIDQVCRVLCCVVLCCVVLCCAECGVRCAMMCLCVGTCDVAGS